MRSKLLLLMMMLTATLVAASPPPQFPSDYFDCVVTGNKDKIVSIVCDSPNRYREDLDICSKHPEAQNCAKLYFDVPEDQMSAFGEWQIAPAKSYSEPPRFQAVPAKGQLLKARWDTDGRFQPVATCEARAYRAVAEYCRDRDYCRHPLSLLTPPGCGTAPTAFIKLVLGSVK